jgi:hypothetical protein
MREAALAWRFASGSALKRRRFDPDGLLDRLRERSEAIKGSGTSLNVALPD